MAQIGAQLSTGLAGLDRLLKGLMPGDAKWGDVVRAIEHAKRERSYHDD